jgi:hypothetical protein
MDQSTRQENFKESKHAIEGCVTEQRVQKVENGYRPLGFGDIFVHFCNRIIPIFMYKYVKGFWVERFEFRSQVNRFDI